MFGKGTSQNLMSEFTAFLVGTVLSTRIIQKHTLLQWNLHTNCRQLLKSSQHLW